MCIIPVSYTHLGSYQDPWEGVYFIDLTSGSIFSMNDEMQVDNVIATMSVSEPQIDKQMFVKSASFAVADGKLYSGFMAIGDETLTVGSQTQKFEMTMTSEGVVEFGHIISVIDLSTGTSSLTKKYSTTHDTVSYTHLDVYKRQPVGSFRCIVCRKSDSRFYGMVPQEKEK